MLIENKYMIARLNVTFPIFKSRLIAVKDPVIPKTL